MHRYVHVICWISLKYWHCRLIPSFTAQYWVLNKLKKCHYSWNSAKKVEYFFHFFSSWGLKKDKRHTVICWIWHVSTAAVGIELTMRRLRDGRFTSTATTEVMKMGEVGLMAMHNLFEIWFTPNISKWFGNSLKRHGPDSNCKRKFKVPYRHY